jgi:vacuolar-type H+-ATPase subunit I/STV1
MMKLLACICLLFLLVNILCLVGCGNDEVGIQKELDIEEENDSLAVYEDNGEVDIDDLDTTTLEDSYTAKYVEQDEAIKDLEGYIKSAQEELESTGEDAQQSYIALQNSLEEMQLTLQEFLQISIDDLEELDVAALEDLYAEQVRAIEDLESELNRYEEELESIGDDEQLADVDLQNMLKKQQQIIEMMSKLSKTLNDMALALIRKTGN